MFTSLLLQILSICVLAQWSHGEASAEATEGENELIQSQKAAYPFTEILDLTVLPRNHILSSFEFQLSSEPADISKASEFTHYKTFPRSLAPILQKTNTRDLHLRFGQGWWDAEEWGQLPNSGATSGGVGIEIWAVVEARSRESSLEQWTSLLNSLSGLFCASLNFIDSANTIFPVNSFKSDKQIFLSDPANQLFLLRAALPAEPVCTENLTPFLKFLPTKGKAGLSSLLDGHRIYEAQWHMMSIDIETECEENLCRYNMNQRIDAVTNVNKALRKKFNPIPRPLPGDQLRCDLSKPFDAFQCFPLGDPEELVFTLEDIFGRTISGGSLISSSPSKICVHTPNNWDVYLRLDGNHFGTPTNCFDLTEVKEYDVYLKSSSSSKVLDITESPIFVSRSLTGYAQDRGDSRTVFRNPTNDPVKLVYLESLPWFMRVYLHTLEITGSSKEDIIQSIYYSPEVDRQRPSHIEFELIIPPNSKIALSYSFDKSLLLYAEYPPDANHGFSVEPGVVDVVEPLSYHLRTSPALLTLPTPDFSMPYNVIILTSTVMSLAFGTIFNLLVKRVVTEEEAEMTGAIGIVYSVRLLKDKLRTRAKLLVTIIISKLFGQRKEEKEPVEDLAEKQSEEPEADINKASQ